MLCIISGEKLSSIVPSYKLLDAVNVLKKNGISNIASVVHRYIYSSYHSKNKSIHLKRSNSSAAEAAEKKMYDK